MSQSGRRLILSPHSRFTECECHKEDINDDDESGRRKQARGNKPGFVIGKLNGSVEVLSSHIDWYFIAEQPAPAPHLAHPEGCDALRNVLVTVPRVSRSCEHFPDGFDLHLPPTLDGC